MLVEEMGIGDRVVFRRRVPQEQLAGFYSAADLCVLPSYYESFGLVSLESLACGTPVVANDVGQMRSIIEQGINGFVTPDNRPETLAEYISLAISKFNRLVTDKAMIRSSVSGYTWSTVAEGIVRELRTALALQSSPVA
jgi:D-inositol-3-phosphate glycosyltransferase